MWSKRVPAERAWVHRWVQIDDAGSTWRRSPLIATIARPWPPDLASFLAELHSQHPARSAPLLVSEEPRCEAQRGEAEAAAHVGASLRVLRLSGRC